MGKRAARLVLAVSAAVLLIGQAHAAKPRPVRRLALVVGSNRGLGVDQPLRYAEVDAANVANVLRHLGGFERDGLVELYTPNAQTVLDAVDRLVADVRATQAQGKQALVVFYYSGHSDGEALRTGGDLVPFVQLRRALKASGAPVRLLIIDACRAGALTRNKGAVSRPPIEVRALGNLATEGEAFIASTTSDELARESGLLRGSFFTHHLVSGLRGAADRSGDGNVTLVEAYDYAYARTVKEAVGEQHPSYAFNLSGRGDVVLTSLHVATATLTFDPGPERHFIVVAQTGAVVAEVKVAPSAGASIALPPGRYELRFGDPSSPRTITVDLNAGANVTIPADESEPRSGPLPTAKGGDDPLEREWVPVVYPPATPPRNAAPTRPHRSRLLLGLYLGSGIAVVGDGSETEVAWQKSDRIDQPYKRAGVQATGALPVLMHLRLDVGVRLVEKWDLLASIRAQVYVGANAETLGTDSGNQAIGGSNASKGALAALVRLRRRFPMHYVAPFVEAAIGAGEVRGVLDLSGSDSIDAPLVDEATARAQNQDPTAVLNSQIVCRPTRSCYDSVALGYALAGVGFGMEFELYRHDKGGLALTQSTTLLGAFGGRSAGLVVDVALGLLAHVF